MSSIVSTMTDLAHDASVPDAIALAGATVADLLRNLGDISADRVLLRPSPGLASEAHVIEVQSRDGRLCELIGGVLVEKGMGIFESRLAAILIAYLEFNRQVQELGMVLGPDGMVRLAPGVVAVPDASFIRWDRLPGGKAPTTAMLEVAPDLVVKVLSPGNTPREMDRKLHEYFAAGVRLVWYVDPPTRRVTVYTSPSDSRVLDESQSLDGGDVLPGFSLSIGEWFNRASQPR
jgi:Uma2 family endonuclease